MGEGNSWVPMCALYQATRVVYKHSRWVWSGQDYCSIDPLLRACPCLQKLNVVMPCPLDCKRRVTEEPPQYLHTQLEEVHIGGFFLALGIILLTLPFICWKARTVMLKRITIDSRSKLYSGSGQLASGNSNRWSAEVRKLICDELQGRNLSGDIEVIIRWYRLSKQLWLWWHVDNLGWY